MDLAFKLVNQSLTLCLDHEKCILVGSAELKLKVFNKNISKIELNARQLKIHSIHVNDRPAEYAYETESFSAKVKELEEEIASSKEPNLSPINFNKVLESAVKNVDLDYSRNELVITIPNDVLGTNATGDSTDTEKFISIKIEYFLKDPHYGAFFKQRSSGPFFFTHNHDQKARYWLPCFDSTAIRCRWEICIINKNHSLCTLSIGDLVKNSVDVDSNIQMSCFVQNNPSSAADVCVVVGNIEGHSLSNESINLFYEQGKQTKASLLDDYCLKCSEFFKWFLNSAFPFNILNVAFVPGYVIPSVTYSNLVILSSDMLFDATLIEQPFLTKSLLSLSIAHCYFGSYIFSKSPDDSWLILSIAYYLNRNFLRLVFGNNDFKLQLKLDMEEVASKDISKVPLYNFNALHEFSSIFIYKKGSLILYLIEQKIEQQLLQKILNNILSEYSNNEMDSGLSTHHFFKLIKKMTGKDLKSLSDQYIFNAGCPIFSCSFSFNRTKSVIELNLRQQSSSETQKFYGQLIIRIFEAEGIYDHVIQIDESSNYFELPVYTKIKKKLKKRKFPSEDTNAAMENSTSSLANPEDLEHDPEDIGDEDFDENDDLSVTAQSNPVEWILVDPELLWIATFHITQFDFMWIDCLQEEMDVISQFQAIRALQSAPSEAAAIAFEKIASNWRIFYKIRCESCLGLTKCSIQDLSFIGTSKLIDIFTKKFCFQPSPKIPPSIFAIKPNNFEHLQNSFIRKTLLLAIAFTHREGLNSVSEQAFNLLLSALQMNDNSENSHSDVDYFSGVFYAITCAIQVSNDPNVIKTLGNLVGEIDRFLFLDRLFPSFHNSVTIACLTLLKKLQALNYVPIDFEVYSTLAAKENYIDVRIASIEGLCLFGCENPEIFMHLLQISYHDSDFVFRRACLMLLLKALKLSEVNFGMFEEQSSIKSFMLMMLYNVYDTEIKSLLLQIAKVVFKIYSVPALEECDENEINEENILEDEALESQMMDASIDKSDLSEQKSKIILKTTFNQPSAPESEAELAARIKNQIFKRLYSFPDAVPFKFPVDPDTAYYYEIIDSPMDLSKISAKTYDNLHQFWMDFVLMLKNCFSFNDHNSSVANCGKKVRNLLYREIKKICPIQEQGTLISLMKDGTDISHEIPIVRYCLLQLINAKISDSVNTFLQEVKEKINLNEVKNFDEFCSEISSINTVAEISATDSAELIKVFEESLAQVGKRKSTTSSRPKKRVESVIDAVVSKIKFFTDKDSEIQSNLFTICNEMLSKISKSDTLCKLISQGLLTEDNEDRVQSITISQIDNKLNGDVCGYETVENFENDIIKYFELCYACSQSDPASTDEIKQLERIYIRDWTKLKEKSKKLLFGSASKLINDFESHDLIIPRSKKIHREYSKDSLFVLVASVLNELILQPMSEPFIYPVSRNVATYYSIIKDPISLINMQEKLLTTTFYSKYDSFEADFELLLKNCYFFNQSSSFIFQMGKKLELYYVSELVPLIEVGKFKSTLGVLSDKDRQKIVDILDKMTVMPEVKFLLSKNPILPFSFELLSKKFKQGFYNSFGEFDRDFRFFLSFVKENLTIDTKFLSDTLDIIGKFYASISTEKIRLALNLSSIGKQSASGSDQFSTISTIPKIKLSSRSNGETALSIDISKIPATPKPDSNSLPRMIEVPIKMAPYSTPYQKPELNAVSIGQSMNFYLQLFFEKLLKLKSSSQFLQISDVPSNVKNMDFNTIYQKFLASKYENFGTLQEDLDLVLYNAEYLHGSNSTIARSATKVDAFIKKEFAELLKGTGSSTSQEKPVLSNITVKSDKLLNEESDLFMSLIQQLISMDYSAPFREPINLSADGSFDNYLNIVKHPIDLGLISERLQCGVFYASAEDVIEDIYRVFFNAFAFFPIDSETYQQAVKCQTEFEKLLSQLPKTHNTFTPISADLVKNYLRSIMCHELVGPFLNPVDYETLGIPKYKDMIRQPMDFSTMLSNDYFTEEEFIKDLRLIFKNCCKFNLENSDLWKVSKVLGEYCHITWKIFKELSIESEVSISFLNEEIFTRLIKSFKEHPYSSPFLYPVDTSIYVTYKKYVKDPIDLSAIESNICKHMYTTPKLFHDAFKLMFKNCYKFNGKDAEISKMAQAYEEFVDGEISKYFFIKKK